MHVLNELEEMFSLVRKTLLEEREKLLEEITQNPKGEMTYRFDLKAEEIAIEYSKGKFGFPVRILSEERGETLTKEGTPKYTLMIDPVDGSTNFKKGIEVAAFSVAVLPAEKPLTLENVEFGLVGNLFSGSICKARKGEGSYFNGVKAKASQNTDVEKAIVNIDTDAPEKKNKKRYLRLLQTVESVRRLGSASLEVTAVATGAVDAHVDIRDELTPENFMAAYLLVKEAGGVFTDWKGKELPEIKSMTDRFNIVVSGNRELHEKILALIDF